MTCGGGTRKRERMCIGGVPGDSGCRGAPEEIGPCRGNVSTHKQGCGVGYFWLAVDIKISPTRTSR